MADYLSPSAANPQHMQAFGNTVTQTPAATALPATFTTTDKAKVARIPGGTIVTDVEFENTDMDTATTLAVNVGFEAAGPNSTLAANATYFAAASTFLRTASSSAGRTRLSFAPIKFEEDVFLTIIPSAGPATTAGTVTPIVKGIANGVK